MFKIVLLVIVLAAIAYFIYPKPPEAREWLISNDNKHALAGNRFASTQDAISFVENLYSVGAIKVTIPKSAIYDSNNRIQQEGGPYADALEISLPTTQSEREAIFNIANQEAANQGMAFNPESDVIKNKLLLWWD
ncbi:hypothetical protein [Pseudoalteromonas neustonica]|uniref:hypothetical protein n=1 Tax=Pseudoalteromonas neustonica TaxID=1840331 RepID=UPI0007DB3ED6|nr:hypothetical protein [Pseudoalteromonas neustonica]